MLIDYYEKVGIVSGGGYGDMTQCKSYFIKKCNHVVGKKDSKYPTCVIDAIEAP